LPPEQHVLLTQLDAAYKASHRHHGPARRQVTNFSPPQPQTVPDVMQDQRCRCCGCPLGQDFQHLLASDAGVTPDALAALMYRFLQAHGVALTGQRVMKRR
jgi:hypothetical protein